MQRSCPGASLEPSWARKSEEGKSRPVPPLETANSFLTRAGRLWGEVKVLQLCVHGGGWGGVVCSILGFSREDRDMWWVKFVVLAVSHHAGCSTQSSHLPEGEQALPQGRAGLGAPGSLDCLKTLHPTGTYRGVAVELPLAFCSVQTARN